MAKTLVLICFKVTEISNVQIQSLSSVNIHQRGRNISHLKRVLFILWLGSLKWNCQNNPTHWTIPSLCNIAYQGKPLKGPSSFNEIALSSPFVKEGTIFKLPHLNHQERVKHRNIMYHFFLHFSRCMWSMWRGYLALNDLYYSTENLKSEAKKNGINRIHCQLIIKFIIHTFSCSVSLVGTSTVSSRKQQPKLYTSVGLPWGFKSKTWSNPTNITFSNFVI